MAASSVQNPVTQGESKSSKKKKAKAAVAEAVGSPAPTGTPAPEKGSEAGDDAGESPYIRDLQK